jgi:hypothetical protein
MHSFPKYITVWLLTVILMALAADRALAQSRYGQHDTILTTAVVYEGDTIEAKTLPGIYVWGKGTLTARERWTRLRNAVFVTYPYARQAGIVFNDIEKHIAGNPDRQYVSNYINSKEKQLKKEFTEPLTNLSVYQGKVLMKLINRETRGVDCFDIVKQLKGGFSARLWETVAFFFGSDLKQPYDALGEDAEMEAIVKQVQRMYGYRG